MALLSKRKTHYFFRVIIVSLMTGVLKFGITLLLVSVCIVIIIYLIDRVYSLE